MKAHDAIIEKRHLAANEKSEPDDIRFIFARALRGAYPQASSAISNKKQAGLP